MASPSRKQFSRRSFLQGLGATLFALPGLSLLSSRSAGATPHYHCGGGNLRTVLKGIECVTDPKCLCPSNLRQVYNYEEFCAVEGNDSSGHCSSYSQLGGCC
jgi:hypothetical protein